MGQRILTETALNTVIKEGFFEKVTFEVKAEWRERASCGKIQQFGGEHSGRREQQVGVEGGQKGISTAKYREKTKWLKHLSEGESHLKWSRRNKKISRNTSHRASTARVKNLMRILTTMRCHCRVLVSPSHSHFSMNYFNLTLSPKNYFRSTEVSH